MEEKNDKVNGISRYSVYPVYHIILKHQLTNNQI